MENNKTIVTRRDTLEKTELDLDDSLLDNIIDILEDMDEKLYENAWDNQEAKFKFTDNIDEIPQLIEEDKVLLWKEIILLRVIWLKS